MKTLVVYQSKTGFTQKYAQWIAEDLGCELRSISDVNESVIAGYDLVIHGGWLLAGVINGLDKLRSYKPKKLIAFGVGFTPKENMDMGKLAEGNKLTDSPVFYFEGGINPPKMGFAGRTIVKAVTKKPLEYMDLTDRASIAPLVNAARN